MDIREVKELIEILKNTDYSYIEIKHEGSQIILSKEGKEVSSNKNKLSQSVEASIVTKAEASVENITLENSDDYYIIKSPIVGVFYSAPAPGEEDFVKKGDKVKKGDTLCIIEAMKLMNEIDSEVNGEIVDILICNESVVEYGQPLFKLKVL